jgi:predicted sugar kinase
MKALDETLSDRVDELIRAHRGQRLLSTTGSQAALAELAARTEGLEKAVREIAIEVQRLHLP